MSFEIVSQSHSSRARVGKLATNHGALETPFFIPIATRGAVKTVSSEDLLLLGAPIILGNTYHLMLRPGLQTMEAARGLHRFMNWPRPILTDSGGYQVFSLTHLRKLNEGGVTFRSPLDGSEQFLSPERSVEVQNTLGSDLVMAFDECTEFPVSEERARSSMELTTHWAVRSKEHYRDIRGRGLMFGIIQGSTFPNLREESARALLDIGFDGYAIGGLSIGEPRELTYELVDQLDQIVPANHPRYFMGAGRPEEIVAYVRRGIDMFDCVLPTRNARHGLLYRFRDREDISSNFYETLHITNEQFREDMNPIDLHCICPTCRYHSRAYLRHLFTIHEVLGERLATLHNLRFYLELMEMIRGSIRADKL